MTCRGCDHHSYLGWSDWCGIKQIFVNHKEDCIDCDYRMVRTKERKISLTDDEFLKQLGKLSNKDLMESLEHCGHDGYYSKLYYPIMEEVRKRLKELEEYKNE